MQHSVLPAVQQLQSHARRRAQGPAGAPRSNVGDALRPTLGLPPPLQLLRHLHSAGAQQKGRIRMVSTGGGRGRERPGTANPRGATPPRPVCWHRSQRHRSHLLCFVLLIQVVIEPHSASCAERQPQQVAPSQLLQRGRKGGGMAPGPPAARVALERRRAPPARTSPAAVCLPHHASRQPEQPPARWRGWADGGSPVAGPSPATARPGRRCRPHCHRCCYKALHRSARRAQWQGLGFFP